MDVLRGFAVLGILAVNIYAFAMPFAAYYNPFAYGEVTNMDLATWTFSRLHVDHKLNPIFLSLLGAGVVIISARAETRNTSPVRLFLRRSAWLFAIGLIHSYLLWWGDILVAYAVCGLAFFPLRRASPRTLLITGTALISVGLAMSVALGSYYGQLKQEAERAEAAAVAGATLSEDEAQSVEAWQGVQPFLYPTPRDLAREVEINRSGLATATAYRAQRALTSQTAGLLTDNFWRMGGLILIGMALIKLDVFTARRSRRFYVNCLMLGYGVGLPLALYNAYDLVNHDFDAAYYMTTAIFSERASSYLVAMAHIAAVVLVCKSGVLPWLRQRLAATGRMSLTVYLTQSLLCGAIFYGYGLGLFGQVSRFGQLGIVAMLWIFFLMACPLWMGHFRFGPAEWLLRSLTYRSRQPMRRQRPLPEAGRIAGESA